MAPATTEEESVKAQAARLGANWACRNLPKSVEYRG